jgi:hypothetical protein
MVRIWSQIVSLWILYTNSGPHPETFLRHLGYWPTASLDVHEGARLCEAVKTYFSRAMKLEVLYWCERLPGMFAEDHPSTSCARLDSLLLLIALWRTELLPEAHRKEECDQIIDYEFLLVGSAFLLLSDTLLARAKGSGYLPSEQQQRLEWAAMDLYRRLSPRSGAFPPRNEGLAAVNWGWLDTWLERSEEYYRARSRDGMPSSVWFVRLTESACAVRTAIKQRMG